MFRDFPGLTGHTMAAMVSMTIFFLLFVGVLIHLATGRKQDGTAARMARLPLEDESPVAEASTTEARRITAK
jgi:hypothetical protein